MTGYFIWTIVWIVLAAVALAPACWAGNLWIEGDYERISYPIKVTVLAVVTCALVIAFMCVQIQKSDKNNHSWRGGNGPNTVCRYETKTVLVGKVFVPKQYTVCE